MFLEVLLEVFIKVFLEFFMKVFLEMIPKVLPEVFLNGFLEQCVTNIIFGPDMNADIFEKIILQMQIRI